MRFKNFTAVLLLILTAYFSLATSSKKEDAAPVTGRYYILSDCVSPAVDNTVMVTNSIITAPPGISFIDFGFPTATIGPTVNGLVGALNRECTVTYGENGSNNVDNRWLYSCFDAGKFKCSIYVQPQ